MFVREKGKAGRRLRCARRCPCSVAFVPPRLSPRRRSLHYARASHCSTSPPPCLAFSCGCNYCGANGCLCNYVPRCSTFFVHIYYYMFHGCSTGVFIVFCVCLCVCLCSGGG